MATAAKILDQQRFEARARIVDIVAIALVFIVGFFLMVEMYRLGNTLAEVSNAGGQAVAARDARWVVVGVESALLAICLVWISYRVFAARRIG